MNVARNQNHYSHIHPDDQEGVAVVAQALWACQADLTVLVGLPGPAAVSKVCALLNLWDQSNGTGMNII